jgi:hypothetical protein
MSTARHHAEWLSLLEISGPFLSMPVLLRAFPQGLDALDTDLKSDLRVVYEEWLDNQGGLQPDPAIHHAWVEWVLRRLLEMPDEVIRNGSDDVGERFTVTVAEHGETLRPDFVIVEPDDGTNGRALVQVVPPGQDLERRLKGSAWSASPATRMMTLLHATDVRLGLVTNGERWMLVDAPKDETTGFISWYAELWLDEPLTLRAFRTLLNVRRFFAVSDEETIEALLAESSSNQQDVTEQLGLQMRLAVEVLIQAIDLADQDRGRKLLAGMSVEALYEAALKVMMRLVFLFSAEERGLLPLDDAFYNQNYAVSTLQAQLREAADQVGEEVLERRHDAWNRLLAAFRAVHGGIRHDRLTLPAYGGKLFDPDELPFLEGRLPGTSWRDTPAQPLPIDNRTVLHLLEALQFLQVSTPGSGPREARRLSFRALDIEQIGHVYESLLDHTAKRTEATVLGLRGAKDREQEILLPQLEAWLKGGEDRLVDILQGQTGRSTSALRNGLHAEFDTLEMQQVRAACGNDEVLCQRVMPFAGLLREDSYGRPMVVHAGSVYVTAGKTRRATGTHYTPRSLTEPIVQHTLEPQVYEGPKEGKPRGEWKLRPPAELLDLKVCDMAMGSGAFLVQACRYLSERLVEAWEQTEVKLQGQKTVLILPEGQTTDDLNQAIPADADERLRLARRLVTDRCLYGVDKNHLAVEMAKLSLWLITLDKGRPFTFLDHALKCGDSIVGVDLDQLTCWNLDVSEGAERHFDTIGIQANIEKMVALRHEIAATPVRDTRDQECKAYLLAKAEALAHDLHRGGDLLIASYYNTLNASEQAALRDALLRAQRDGADVPDEWTETADLGDLHPFHWLLEFPEVFLEKRGGFDAFVGNPPFIGGRRIRDTLGDRYREILYALYPGSSGNADYCAFFFLRAFANLQQGGALGLIATNTIAQGDTRSTGLDAIVKQGGGTIYHVDNDYPWPGAAAVVVDVVHIAKEGLQPPFTLDGKPVQHISSLLNSRRVVGDPHPLAANKDRSFQGSVVVGTGFVLEPEEAQALIEKAPRNEEVLFPYLNGADLNSSPDQSPSRWVINFFDWPLERAEAYAEPMRIVRERVKPQRNQVRRKAHRKYWWHYGDKRPALYRSIASMQRVLVIARVSRTGAFAFVPTGWVYSEQIVVLPLEEPYFFTVLQSTFHIDWAWEYASSLKGDLRYTPRDVLETFPFPQSPIPNLQSLTAIGETYHEYRRQLMLDHQEGLTATYNRFHNPEETAADIVRLRELHVEMDNAVTAAYSWDDLDLGHGFHETPQGLRYTISQEAHWEVLDRLLALNHERYEEEVKAGLHDKKGKKSKRKKKDDEKQMKLF